LGPFSLSGVFPTKPLDVGESGVMSLLLCSECTLVQLADSFEVSSMFGDNYGYRSGLNASMVSHLSGVADYSRSLTEIVPGDVVLDIGSNDGTLLRNFGPDIVKIGIDPSASKFREFYDEGSLVVSNFFTKDRFYGNSSKKAKIITSIAMLYDLESPVDFASDVRDCLDQDGVWIFEQSYMPWMVLTGAYDTICHEHIEYYSLTSITRMLDLSGLKIVDVALNHSNGGSIRVAATHLDSKRTPSDICESLTRFEQRLNLSAPEFFAVFVDYVKVHPIELKALVDSLAFDGKNVTGLGASTKGSILIQNAKLSAKELSSIGEVNPYKVGRWMANSDIPIRLEDKRFLDESDAVVVFPWHFEKFFARILKDFISRGGLVIWPLPSIRLESKHGKQVMSQIKTTKSVQDQIAELETFGLTN
jgi:hypothetical protein